MRLAKFETLAYVSGIERNPHLFCAQKRLKLDETLK
jgi:hypothetical protein